LKPTQILLVEDDPNDAALTLHALRKANICNEVIVAKDGADALQYLFGETFIVGREDLPALVLLDLRLPKVSGLEVLERIRGHERTRMLPVLILTSSDDEQAIMKGHVMGANAIVRKPVTAADFTGAAKQLGLYWFLVDKAPALG
jgi:two-component system response regulator